MKKKSRSRSGFFTKKIHLLFIVLIFVPVVCTLAYRMMKIQAAEPITMYYVCEDPPDALWSIDPDIGDSSKVMIGTLGITEDRALAWDFAGDELYGANGNVLGTISTISGSFTPKPSPFGTGTGSLGSVPFTDIRGLAFDPFTLELYAVNLRAVGSDVLFKVDKDTGLHISDAFGPGLDYVVIDEDGVYLSVYDVAISHIDGTLRTIATNGSDDQLLEINKFTGEVLVTGSFGAYYEMEGLTYSYDGRLWGTRDAPDEMVLVDTSGPSITAVADLTDGGYCDAEALTARNDTPNIMSGRVWHDADQNQAINSESGISGITVELYIDENNDGLVDGGDSIIQTTTTNGTGFYSFTIFAQGNFVMKINTGSLPPGYGMTTDNVEEADFTSFDNEEEDNNFGADDDTDCDSDGIPDFIESPLGTEDFDGDGVANECDLDSDDDGITDVIESTEDTDSDTRPNYLDVDSDNDGIPDAIEANDGVPPTDYNPLTGMITGADGDGDGLKSSVDSLPAVTYGASTTTLPVSNFDGDSKRDFIDPDSDSDGILDIIEAGGVDSDGNGKVDSFSDNGKGYHSPLTTSPLPVDDTDSSGKPNYIDLDADDDGIPDFREGPSTADYLVPAAILDSDSDGIIDAYDVSVGGDPIVPVDTDNDSDPDYVELDSDNDTESDLIEGHDADGNGVAEFTFVGTDTDDDGIDDGFDTDDANSSFFYNNVDVSNDPPTDADGGSAEYDWREINAPNADLSTTKTDGLVTAEVDEELTYVITISNAGPDLSGTGVTLSDTLPTDVTVNDGLAAAVVLSGANAADWSCASNAASPQIVSCTTTVSIAVSGSSTISFTADPLPASVSGTTVENEVTVSNTILDLDAGNNTSTDETDIEPVVDLSITKTDGRTTVAVDDEITYTFVVSNAGPSGTVNSVITFVDTLPDDVTVNGGSAGVVGPDGANSANWTCSSNSASPQIVTCTSTTNISNGGSSTFSFATDSIPSSLTGTTLTNFAEVSIDATATESDVSNNTAEDTDTIVSGGGGGGGGGGGCSGSSCNPPPPPPPPTPDPEPEPEPEPGPDGTPVVCNVCGLLTYDVYIVNPDGSERHSGTPWVQQKLLENGLISFAFEDKTLDTRDPLFDHNDVIVYIDKQNCDHVGIKVISSDAAWNHQVWLRVSIAGVEQSDTLVTLNDDANIGVIKYVNASQNINPATACVNPPATCDICTRLTYDVFIVNPDLSERHTNTPWVRATDLGNGIVRLSFEDKTLDPNNPGFDHNDVVIDVDTRNCEGVGLKIISSSAAWRHQVWFAVSVNGVEQNRTLITENDDASIGVTKFVDAKQNVSAQLACMNSPVVPIPTSVVTSAGCSVNVPFVSFLSMGSSGNEVFRLESLLQCLTIFPSDDAPNETYGEQTRVAVTVFQRLRGIDPLGYVGPATRAALNLFVR